MNINFAMWKTALWTLVKMDEKDKWDKLDVVSKWLIATRSAVTTVTIYSCVIGGLLTWRDGHFAWLPWLVVTFLSAFLHSTTSTGMPLMRKTTSSRLPKRPLCR